jgi:serine/threonine-protein kinase
MPLDVGETIGERYRIIKKLGEGGMGAVYQAWDTRLNHPVAVKEMRPQAGLDPSLLGQLRGQFKQEAQILATLVHTNLVRVTDYFSWSGSEFLVMDFVEGDSLAAQIRRDGPQQEAQVAAWARQLLAALGYCHGRGVIHRDIKPHNIIIAPDGRAVLVDFGLVKLWDANDPHTRTVMRGMGTPEYAPPEQYDVGPGHTDPRSDIYGLGATLYHALSGQLPPTATQRMASPRSFLPLRRYNPAVSPGMEAIVHKAMEIPMDRRFQSADQMAQALGVPARAGPTGPRPSPGREGRTGPTREMETTEKRKGSMLLGLGGAGLAALGGGCLLLAVIAVIIVWAISDGGGATPVTPTSGAAVTSTHTPTSSSLGATDTPRPSSTPESGGGPDPTSVLFQDDFSNSASGWETGSYDTGSVGYKGGAYVVTSLGDGNTMWGVANLSFDDVVIDVDSVQVDAPSNNNNGYGVACREQGGANANAYFLLISGDGAYSIIKSVDGDFEWLVDWTFSDVILKGNAGNHIRAVCDGTTLALFVNGQSLASTEDSTYTSGDIALAAVSLEEGEPTQISFDNLVVGRP